MVLVNGLVQYGTRPGAPATEARDICGKKSMYLSVHTKSTSCFRVLYFQLRQVGVQVGFSFLSVATMCTVGVGGLQVAGFGMEALVGCESFIGLVPEKYPEKYLNYEGMLCRLSSYVFPLLWFFFFS